MTYETSLREKVTVLNETYSITDWTIVDDALVCDVSAFVEYRYPNCAFDSASGRHFQMVLKNAEDPVIVDWYEGEKGTFDTMVRTYFLDLTDPANWLESQNVSAVREKCEQVFVPLTQAGAYRPIAVRYLPAHSSSTADYYLQTHADPFTVTAKEFAYGKTQITDPVYKAADAASLVAEEFSGLLPRYSADAIERCCCVSNPNGSGTNFYLFSMGDRLMVGHYRMFGAANPTLSCEYLMELDTGGKSATAIIDSLMNA